MPNSAYVPKSMRIVITTNKSIKITIQHVDLVEPICHLFREAEQMPIGLSLIREYIIVDG